MTRSLPFPGGSVTELCAAANGECSKGTSAHAAAPADNSQSAREVPIGKLYLDDKQARSIISLCRFRSFR